MDNGKKSKTNLVNETPKKRKKKQTIKKITDKKQKIPIASSNSNEEPKPKPKRGRKKKVIVPIKAITEKVDGIFITDEQPVYCRAPIEFGGMTVFTKVERAPSPPPPPPTLSSSSSSLATRDEKKPVQIEPNMKSNKWRLVKLKNENNWKTQIEKSNLKLFNTKIEDENVVCWYCTHTFDGNAVSVPASFSLKRGYLCHGIFCGWGCAKTWNMDSTSQMKFQRNDFINKLIRLSNNGAFVSIPKAPNRYLLKKFGGDLTIDEFREKSLYFPNNNELFNGVSTKENRIRFTIKTPCSEIEFE